MTSILPIQAQTSADMTDPIKLGEETPMADLSTERPGFTSSSGTAGLGVLQLEQGFSLQFARIDGARTTLVAGPAALIRFGIARHFELRISSNGYSWMTVRTPNGRSLLSGANDFWAGAKLGLLEQHKWRPELSITGGVSLPARGSAFTSSGFDPTATLAASKNLPAKLSLTANTIFASVTDPHGRYFSSAESLWVTRGLKMASAFAEVFHTTTGYHEGSETAGDFGFYKGLGKNIQIDAAIGHTISGSQPGWFVTAGVVFRDPRQFRKGGWSGLGASSLLPKARPTTEAPPTGGF